MNIETVKMFIASLGQQFWWWIISYFCIISGVGLVHHLFGILTISALLFILLLVVAAIGSTFGIDQKPGMWLKPYLALRLSDIRKIKAVNTWTQYVKDAAKTTALGITALASITVISLSDWPMVLVSWAVASLVTAIVAQFASVR
jgi:uncharacterized phage infection (PIP) family protein YhgE